MISTMMSTDILVFVDVSFVPAVPDGHIVPVMRPVHVESAEAALLEDLHAIAFYGHLGAG